MPLPPRLTLSAHRTWQDGWVDVNQDFAGYPWVERTGTRTYVGYNARGGQVEIGPGDTGASFTPGELLQIALAGCAGMSSDQRMAIALGPDFKSTLRAIPTKSPAADKYDAFREIMEVDLSGLDDAKKVRTMKFAQSSIDNNCTIGNTVAAGAVVSEVEFTPPAAGVLVPDAGREAKLISGSSETKEETGSAAAATGSTAQSSSAADENAATAVGSTATVASSIAAGLGSTTGS